MGNNTEYMREYMKKYRKTNNWKRYKKDYDKKYYKNKPRRSDDKKYEDYMKAIHDEKLYGQFKSTQTVFDNLIIPVPVFSDDLERTFNDGKYASLFKKSGYKFIFTFIKIYFADNHNIYSDSMFLGTVADLRLQLSSNKYDKIFDFLLQKIHGFASKNEDLQIANGYDYRYNVDWKFLKYEDAVKYIELISFKKFDEARDFLDTKKESNFNATTIRMSLLLKHNYKMKDILTKNFVDDINRCYVKSLQIEKPFLDKKTMSSVAKRMFNKDKTSKEEFVETIKTVKKLDINSVIDKYIEIQNRKIERYNKTLNTVTYEDAVKGLENNIRKTIKKIKDAEKVKNSIQENKIIFEELNDNGREYNLFTQISSELRDIIFAFLGFTFEIDLKFSGIQLMMDIEKKWFKTNSLELVYNKIDELSDEIGEDIKVENGNKKVMRKKSRKQIKRYFTFIMNGGNYENLPYYFRNRASEEMKNKIKNYGRAISNTYIKFKDFYVENKLKFLKKTNKKITEDNIVFFEYTSRERRIIDELKDLLGLVSFRIHDALYVKSPSKKIIDEKLKEFKYDVSVDKITSKLLDYI